jgi:hypothetical protein
MTYASLSDVRAEGVTTADASNARIEALLAEATALIDHATGWYFEPRAATNVLDGRGTPSLELPVPPIDVSRVLVEGAELSLAEVFVVGAPVLPGCDGPRLTLRRGRSFPRDVGNVSVSGTWGYTEVDGTASGRTPLAVRRACLLLVTRRLGLLGDASAQDAAHWWRVIEERTREQSIRFAPAEQSAAVLVGDPEVDQLLRPYLRPLRCGAA